MEDPDSASAYYETSGSIDTQIGGMTRDVAALRKRMYSKESGGEGEGEGEAQALGEGEAQALGEGVGGSKGESRGGAGEVAGDGFSVEAAGGAASNDINGISTSRKGLAVMQMLPGVQVLSPVSERDSPNRSLDSPRDLVIRSRTSTPGKWASL